MARAGWLLSAAIAATVLASVLHVDFAGPVPFAVLSGIAIAAFLRPRWGLAIVAGLVPIAWYGMAQFWNAQVAWAEAVAFAGLAGLGLDACRRHAARTPPPLAAPALLLGGITIASLLVSLRVEAMRLGPAFAGTMASQLTRDYFIDLRTLPALHAGMLLVAGALLFAHAARLSAAGGAVRPACAAGVIGAATASACTIVRLVESARRGASFWTSLFDLAARLRWNVHYADVNAAGSYYALMLAIALGLAWTAGRRARTGWVACAAAIAAGLWLTSSRMAMLALPAAAAGVFLVTRAGARRHLVRAAAIAVTAVLLIALLSLALPQRGIQKSSLVAADVRIGLIETGLRMIRSHPVFGIGLGQFYERSGEFSSPALIATFPVAVHENAHNNFVQVAAELGLTGGIAFAWTIAAALLLAAFSAARVEDRFASSLLAGVTAFVLTCVGGHPLLIPEAAFSFWIFAGLAGGAGWTPAAAADALQQRFSRLRLATIGALVPIAITIPWRMHAIGQAANLEHVAIGVSEVWRVSPDGIRYREATGQASLFIPVDGCKFSVNPRVTSPVRLELRLDGRVVNVVSLTPGRWNDLVVPARNERTDAHFVRLDLRVVDAADGVIWITKDQPLSSDR